MLRKVLVLSALVAFAFVASGTDATLVKAPTSSNKSGKGNVLNSAVEPNYDAKKVKAFSFCIQGYGFLAAPANAGRRRLSAEQVERELAPVEYVRSMSPTAILDCTDVSNSYGSVKAWAGFPVYQFTAVFNSQTGQPADAERNVLTFQVVDGPGAGVVLGVNGPDFKHEGFKIGFSNITNDASGDLLVVTVQDKKRWNPYYSIEPTQLP